MRTILCCFLALCCVSEAAARPRLLRRERRQSPVAAQPPQVQPPQVQPPQVEQLQAAPQITVRPAPVGFYFLRSQEGNANTPTNVWRDPNIAGVSLRRTWAECNPAEDEYDFSYFERQLAVAKQYGKPLQLRVSGGCDSPAWVMSRVKTFDFTNTNEGRPASDTMPVVWDPRYKALWAKFVLNFGERYAHNPYVSLVHIDGPVRYGSEFHLPKQAVNVKGYQINYQGQQVTVPGYSHGAIIQAWKDAIDAYAAAFPAMPLCLNISPAIDARDGVAEAVSAYAVGKLGPKATLQHNALSAKSSDGYYIHKLIVKYGQSGIRVGFQQLCPSRLTRYGGSLQKSLTEAKRARAAYLEIYQRDNELLRAPWQ